MPIPLPNLNSTMQFSTTIHHYITTPPPPPPPTPGPHHKMGLHFAFYWGKATQILFHGWPGHSTAMYALALVFVFVLAVLVEALSYWKLVKLGSNRVGVCFFRIGLHAVRAGVAYMVILAVATYNGGVFIAAILGHAVGYLIFGSGLILKRPNWSSSLDDSGAGPAIKFW